MSDIKRLQARRAVLLARIARERETLGASVQRLRPVVEWADRIGVLRRAVHERPLLAGAVSLGASLLLSTRLMRWIRRGRVLSAVARIAFDRLRATAARTHSTRSGL